MYRQHSRWSSSNGSGFELRLLVVGSLAAATNSAAGLTNTSSNTCPYDPTLTARWLRSHNYSWERLTQCPKAPNRMIVDT